jgi:hypothetical protein
MPFFKLGLLTCLFYVVMTILLEAGLWGMVYFKGFMWFYRGKHPGLVLGVSWGAIFWVLWIISFSAAWFIVYHDLKSKLHFPPD